MKYHVVKTVIANSELLVMSELFIHHQSENNFWSKKSGSFVKINSRWLAMISIKSVLLGWISNALSPYFDGRWLLFSGSSVRGSSQIQLFPEENLWCKLSCLSQLQEEKRWRLLFIITRKDVIFIQLFSKSVVIKIYLLIYIIFLFYKFILLTTFLLDENHIKEWNTKWSI